MEVFKETTFHRNERLPKALLGSAEIATFGVKGNFRPVSSSDSSPCARMPQVQLEQVQHGKTCFQHDYQNDEWSFLNHKFTYVNLC